MEESFKWWCLQELENNWFFFIICITALFSVDDSMLCLCVDYWLLFSPAALWISSLCLQLAASLQANNELTYHAFIRGIVDAVMRLLTNCVKVTANQAALPRHSGVDGGGQLHQQNPEPSSHERSGSHKQPSSCRFNPFSTIIDTTAHHL